MQINENSFSLAIDKVFGDAPSAGGLVQLKFADNKLLTIRSGNLGQFEAAQAKFPIYSVAKAILAIFALKLAEEGKLDLDQPVTAILRRPLPDWLQRVSLRLLLSHRSGLFDYGQMKAYHEAVRKSPGQAIDPNYFVSQALAKGPQFEPGSSFLYSNVGYFFVREIVETTSKMNLQELFDEIVGRPLEISMNLLTGISDRTIEGFSPYLSERALDIRSIYDFSWVYHGTFLARLTDLTALFSQLDGILSPKSLAEMTRLHRLALPHPEIHPSYGLGLMGDMQSKFGPIYGHNGGGPGFSVAAYVATQKSVTVAAVVNRDSTIESEKLVWEVLKLL